MIIELERASQVSSILSKSPLRDMNFVSWIVYDTDAVSLYVDFLTQRLWSNYNHFKVEAHAILTKCLFLINFYEVFIYFEDSKVFFVTEDGKEYLFQYKDWKDLGLFLYGMLDHTKDSSELSYRYDDFRQYTRKITDHLEEDTPTRLIWSQLIQCIKDFDKEHRNNEENALH